MKTTDILRGFLLSADAKKKSNGSGGHANVGVR